MRLLKALMVLGFFLVLAVDASATATLRLPLKKIAPVQDHQLRGTMDSYSFTVPVPARWSVLKATLHFSYVNSSALIPRTSRLTFTVHDQPLAQVRLNPDTPEGEVTVPIPGSLLKTGYNPCNFWVSQHYTDEQCEDPFAPELWTWLKLGEAYLVFELEPVSVPKRVSAIADFLFDPRNIFDTRVNLVIPELSPGYLKAASLAAAGIALRYDYRTPELVLSQTLRPGMDNIVIAARKDLPALVPGEPAGADGPVIAVRHLPETKNAPGPGQPDVLENPHRALVVISAKDEAELETACAAFASLSYPLPDSPSTRMAALKLPEVGEHMLQKGLQPGRSYTLASLGKRTTEFRKISPPQLDVALRLPSDLYLSPNTFVSVILHMAYDAAMRSDSVLNVKINGKFISGVHLDNPKGNYFKGYRVDLPLSSFKQGMNWLSFEAELTPLHTDKCTLIQTENLRLTIFEDSMVVLPEVPYWIKMPQLDLFFQDAFPMGRWPDLREAAVVLTEKNLAAANAALNVVALSSQKIGFPPFGLSWLTSYEPGNTRKDLLIVGVLPSLPTSVIEKAPLAGIDSLRLSFPQMLRPEPRPAAPIDFWPKADAPQQQMPPNLSDVNAASPVRADLSGTLGPGRTALMQFQHPDAAERTVMILTAGIAADLLAGSKTLWDPIVQGGCQGDLFVVNLDKPEPETLAHLIGPSYYLGNPGRMPAVQNFINTHPVLSLAALSVILLALCGLILKLLKRRREQRLNPSAG
ncbi:MAG TPA: cellulose biosynthesis cyclic di-GMP-binding regulatory protein BcsB [Desulfobacterales bacterium]|nr:cellulose biosynthesis cyclic di-GMP-binding regulatory protein BcsB [Desulfobacterales bacterium]